MKQRDVKNERVKQIHIEIIDVTKRGRGGERERERERERGGGRGESERKGDILTDRQISIKEARAVSKSVSLYDCINHKSAESGSRRLL